MNQIGRVLANCVGMSIAAACLMVSGCASAASSADLGELESLAEQCPSAGGLATLVELDGTGSSQEAEIVSGRMAVVRAQATRVAVCSGRLRVAVFSSGVAASRVIFDSVLRPSGATQIAQLRRVPALVDSVMAQIEAGYPQAVASLPQQGSDVAAVFRSGAEFASQVSAASDPAPQVSLVVLTDGVQTVGLPLDRAGLTEEKAARLAASMAPVSLSGVAVIFAGIGRVSGAVPSTANVEALKVFYRKVCEASKAASCIVVTDYAEAR